MSQKLSYRYDEAEFPTGAGLAKDHRVDKVATLKAVLSSSDIEALNHDMTGRVAFIPFRGAIEPVLMLELSELVGWLRLEGDNAIWRYGSMLTGGGSMPYVMGNPLNDGGRALSDAVDHAYGEIQPLWPPESGEDGEPERFAAAIEGGERPAPWSQSVEETPEFVHRPAPAVPAAQAAATEPAAAPQDSSPYATDFVASRHDKTRHPAAPGYGEQQLDGRVLQTVHPATVPAVIGAAALFLAILPMPYEFYVLLRWLVPAMAIWACTLASGQKRTGWAVVFTLIAILWNPLVPFEMPRSAWVLPDLVGAALFAAAGVNLKASKPALR